MWTRITSAALKVLPIANLLSVAKNGEYNRERWGCMESDRKAAHLERKRRRQYQALADSSASDFEPVIQRRPHSCPGPSTGFQSMPVHASAEHHGRTTYTARHKKMVPSPQVFNTQAHAVFLETFNEVAGCPKLADMTKAPSTAPVFNQSNSTRQAKLKTKGPRRPVQRPQKMKCVDAVKRAPMAAQSVCISSRDVQQNAAEVVQYPMTPTHSYSIPTGNSSHAATSNNAMKNMLQAVERRNKEFDLES